VGFLHTQKTHWVFLGMYPGVWTLICADAFYCNQSWVLLRCQCYTVLSNIISGCISIKTRTSLTLNHHPNNHIRPFYDLSSLSTIRWCHSNFSMISLTVFSSYRFDTQTDRQTHKQTLGVKRVVINPHRTAVKSSVLVLQDCKVQSLDT